MKKEKGMTERIIVFSMETIEEMQNDIDVLKSRFVDILTDEEGGETELKHAFDRAQYHLGAAWSELGKVEA